MRPILRNEIAHVRRAYGASPSMGLMPCAMPNCDQATRLRHPVTGTPICGTCSHAAQTVYPYLTQQWWKKPKGFRLATRKSKVDEIVLRDGPLNGQHVRRGTKHQPEGKKSATVVTWRTGFIRLVERHPEEGLLLAVGGSTAPVVGGYVYDSTDDSYWWVA